MEGWALVLAWLRGAFFIGIKLLFLLVQNLGQRIKLLVQALCDMGKTDMSSHDLLQFKKHFSEDAFWKKLRGIASKVGIKTVYYALVLFYTLTDENTPAKYRAIIAGALGYLILPMDVIPDFMPFAGMADDWAALLAAVAYITTAITPEIKAKAKLKLQDWFADVKNTDLGDLA